MPEQHTPSIAQSEAAQPELWNPGGSLLAILLASVALFFVASMITLIGACVLTSIVDVPH